MKRVSSFAVMNAVAAVLFLVLIATTAGHAQTAAKVPVAAASERAAGDPQKLFEAGDAALRAGKLDEAARDFQQVVAIDPSVAGAYANLGVIAMRRKQWPKALEMLHKA